MKRFEFPLDRVLRVKRQLERAAEMEQQKAAAGVDAAHRELGVQRENLRRFADKIAASVGKAVSPHSWTVASDGGEHLDEAIRRAEVAVAEAEKVLAAAAAARSKIAAEVEALATLRQQQWDLWSRENQTKVQSELDEVGLRRWMAARQDADEREVR